MGHFEYVVVVASSYCLDRAVVRQFNSVTSDKWLMFLHCLHLADCGDGFLKREGGVKLQLL